MTSKHSDDREDFEDEVDGSEVAIRSETITDDEMSSLLQEIMKTQQKKSLRLLATDNLNYTCHRGHKLQLKSYENKKKKKKTTGNNENKDEHDDHDYHDDHMHGGSGGNARNNNSFCCTLCRKEYVNQQQCWQCNSDEKECGELFLCHGCAELDNNSKLHYFIASKLYEKIIKNKTKEFASSLDEMINNNNNNLDHDFILNKWHSKDDNYGHSLLTAASQHNNIDIIKLLLKYKLNVNVQCIGDKFTNATPLWLACFNGNVPIVKLLIENNADPNIFETSDNITTLMAAAFHGNVTIIDLLMNASNVNSNFPNGVGKEKKANVGFDFVNLTNQCQKRNGYSAFQLICQKGHLDCLKHLFKICDAIPKAEIDVYHKDFKFDSNGLHIACSQNHTSVVRYLLKNVYFNNNSTKNKNIINDRNNHGCTAFYLACLKGNLEIMKMLARYDCDINFSNRDGKSPLYIACEKNHFKCVEWLCTDSLNVQQVNYNKISSKSSETPLMIASISGSYESCRMMCSNDKVKILDIHDEAGHNAVQLAAIYGQTRIIQLLTNTVSDRFNINDWDTLISHDFVEDDEDLDENETDNLLNIHTQNTTITRLSTLTNLAIGDTVVSETKEIDDDDNLGQSELNRSSLSGSRKSRYSSRNLAGARGSGTRNSKQLLLNRRSTLSTLMLNQNKLGFEKLWISLIKFSKKFHKTDTFAFLDNLYKNAFLKENFLLLKIMLESDRDDNINKEKIYQNSVVFQQNKKCARILYDYCIKQDPTMKLSKQLHDVITKMILNKEPINDILLLYSNIVDNVSLSDTIEATMKSIFNSKNKNSRDMAWFSNHIVNSNLFCLPHEAKASKANRVKSDITDYDGDEVKTGNTRDSGGSADVTGKLKYDVISLKVIEDQLRKQQEYLRQHVSIMESKYEQSWKQLINIKNQNFYKHGILQQNQVRDFFTDVNFMDKNGIKVDYIKNELNNDILTGFNLRAAYDNNVIATQLLIMANKVNYQFQKDCRKIFKQIERTFNINCNYKGAPIKSLDRVVIKAATDYHDKSWPHTVNVIDLVRCSIHVETPKELYDVFNKFYQMVYISKKSGVGCIKSILRIKNGFNQFINFDLNKNKQQIGYCDIKCNVLIELQNIALIGEIQFLLSFMLKAKQMSHKLYEFERKKEYFYELYNMISYSNNNESLLNKMNHIIAVHDMKKLSQFLLYSDKNQTQFLIENKQHIIKLMNQNKWSKGLKLLNDSMIDTNIQQAH